MSHTVLVVEDDLDIRQALMEILDEHGFAALGARDGAEALDLLSRATELPCLILLDLMMPVMDGASFREAQRKDPRLASIPVVVLSAYRGCRQARGSARRGLGPPEAAERARAGDGPPDSLLRRRAGPPGRCPGTRRSRARCRDSRWSRSRRRTSGAMPSSRPRSWAASWAASAASTTAGGASGLTPSSRAALSRSPSSSAAGAPMAARSRASSPRSGRARRLPARSAPTTARRDTTGQAPERDPPVPLRLQSLERELRVERGIPPARSPCSPRRGRRPHHRPVAGLEGVELGVAVGGERRLRALLSQPDGPPGRQHREGREDEAAHGRRAV